MKVKGPNGLVITVSESLGRALLVNEEFRRVDDKPKADPKSKK